VLDLDEAQQLQEATPGVNTPQEGKSIDDSGQLRENPSTASAPSTTA
jgi:hypothetical protein